MPDSGRTHGAALFDIDGTLVDSNYVHVNAWQRAFHAVGHPVDAWRIHRAIGMGSSQLLSLLLGVAADELGGKVKQLHSDFYRESSELLRPFEHARDLVTTLAGRGAKVVLASSAAPDELALLRAILDIDQVVAAITSSENVQVAKPDPEIVEVALDRAQTTAGHAVFIGDAVWDVLAAKQVGVPTIGLLSGGTSAAELTEAGAVAIYDDAAALLRELDSSPLAAICRPVNAR
jgi:HAD superfamily hydrolase (TIGR01509 family)